MDRDRRLAFLILKDIKTNEAWSNLTTGKFLSKEGADSPAFVREIVYGVIRNQKLLDYNINKFLKKPKLGTSERIWLEMGFYQLCFMSGVAEHAAINETVELARNFKKGSEGFINAILRSFQRSGKELVYPNSDKELRDLSKKNQVESLAIKYSFDENIVKLWLDNYGFDQTDALLSASNTVAPMCIRVNSIKCSDSDVIERLSGNGYELEKASVITENDCIIEVNNAFNVKGKSLLETNEYKNGLFSVQGLSSQMAVQVLNPKQGSLVLDLCAAPGGKSFAMAALMKNKGFIKAFDLYEHRVALIDKEKEKLGISIIESKVQDSSKLMNEYIGKADCVLCDVPCSGLGTLRENPEIKLRSISKDLPNIQKSILTNAALYVRDGGKLLYSTCTINPYENQNVISDFLSNTKGFEIEEEYQLFTKANGQDGFYICLLRRV